MNRRLATIFVIFGIVFFILGVLLYVQKQNVDPTQDVETSREVVEEIAPGVTIVEREDGRFLRNERDGYEILVEDGLEIKNIKNNLAFYDTKQFHMPIFTLNIEENNSKLNIEDWIENYHKENYLLFYDQREKLKINNLDVVKVQEEGEVMVYSYYILLNDKVLVFTMPTDILNEDILNSINSI